MKYIIYTTTKPSSIETHVKHWAKQLEKSKGRGKVEYDIVQKRVDSVDIIYSNKHWRINWDWFTSRFPKGDYDGVIFHFTSYYKKKWQISSKLNGSMYENAGYPCFWICCNPNDKADDYEEAFFIVDKEVVYVNEFLRLMFHEQAHFDENLDDLIGNQLKQESVHLLDYKAHAIHRYPELVDFRGYNIKILLEKVIRRLIELLHAK